ncbi:MAG: iron transporter [Desulfobacter sp.]|nr:iron transporter [Desulfobacter sp.]WDP87863.1 MAG: iron transporter [Desulfobacter sp.]
MPLPMTHQNPESVLNRVRTSIEQGLKKGWTGLLWLLKILVPISFFTALLVHFKLLFYLDFLLEPMMSLIHLPAAAAVVLIIGMFTGIYGTVAALSVMSFSMDHMTLIAIFTLISHNLIQESIVQGNSGINPFKAAAFRLVMAFVVTFVCGKLMDVSPGLASAAALEAGQQGGGPLGPMLKDWTLGTCALSLQILCIIMPLMVMLELAKTFQVIEAVTKIFSPVTAFMGLDRSCAMLWLTASVFGLAYGSAVIVEETGTNKYDKEALTRLHLSIGVNHAMIEDPALFLPLGISVFWLWIPRLAAAMAVVWLYSGFSFARRLYAKRVGHKKLCDH